MMLEKTDWRRPNTLMLILKLTYIGAEIETFDPDTGNHQCVIKTFRSRSEKSHSVSNSAPR